MTDGMGNGADVASYLLQVWRAECESHGDDVHSWPQEQSMDLARALTGMFDDEDVQLNVLESAATGFLAAGSHELSSWRLDVLDRVLRAGGSDYGLAAIAHLYLANSSPVPPPASGPVTEDANDQDPAAASASEVDGSAQPADFSTEPVGLLTEESESADSAPEPEPSVVRGSADTVEPSDIGERIDIAGSVDVGGRLMADAVRHTAIDDSKPADANADADAAGMDATGRRQAASAPPDLSGAMSPVAGLLEGPAGDQGPGQRPDHTPFWARVDTTTGGDALPGEMPVAEPVVGHGALPPMPEPPWPDDFESVPLAASVAAPDVSADSAGSTASVGKTASTAGSISEGPDGVEPPAASGSEVSDAPSRNGVGVVVSDRATFESTVCSLVDDKTEFTVAFVGLDEVPGASLGVPDDPSISPDEDAACRALLWSLARRAADRATCYAIGRGLVAVVLDRGRPKDVDKMVRKLPSQEVSTAFSWGSARFPEEANEVRELLRMALVRLANMREEKLTPRILVNRIRRAVSTRT